MTDLERLAAEHACAQLAIAYCVHTDNRDTEAMLGIWAEDGVWDSIKGPLRGHAEIRAYLEARPKAGIGRHISANQVVRVIDAEHAEGSSYFVFYRDPAGAPGSIGALAGAESVGRYFDRYVRTAQGWRIAHRRMEFSLRK